MGLKKSSLRASLWTKARLEPEEGLMPTEVDFREAAAIAYQVTMKEGIELTVSNQRTLSYCREVVMGEAAQRDQAPCSPSMRE